MISKRVLIILLGLVFILAACAETGVDTEAPEASQAALETEEVVKSASSQETEEPAPEDDVEEIDIEATEEQIASTEAPDEQPFDLTSMSGCRSKEPLAVAYDVLSPPTGDDWSLGSEDASVTIIEYADFQ